MNLSSLFRRPSTHDVEPTEAELAEQEAAEKALRIKNAPKHGPRKVSYLSQGQYSRLVKRGAASQQRKATRRFRRQWMANELAVAKLRGQLETVAAIKTPSGRYLVGQSGELMRITHEHLEKVYGSVEAATEHYLALVAERRRVAKVSA